MFTGIVHGSYCVYEVLKAQGLISYCVSLSDELISSLTVGSSVSVDGVCQTVVRIERDLVFFDAIQETLDKTTLVDLKVGRWVNIERSLRVGDELGGHLLSGHVYGTAQIKEVSSFKNNLVFYFLFPEEWVKFFFKKGFVAIDGVSLTCVDVFEKISCFSVHLIPETLKITTLGQKKIYDRVNIEVDFLTQMTVQTVERFFLKK